MKIVFDLDNTLSDEQGKNLRPGAKALLDKLKSDGHKLVLWTNSVRERTKDIMKELKLENYFEKIISREDYDPNSKDGFKDIRKVGGELIIDDNPEQEKYAIKYKYKAIIVKPFSSFRKVGEEEFKIVYDKIKKMKGGFFKKFFSL